MSFLNANAHITQLKNQLLACSSNVIIEENIHYPNVDLRKTSFPCCIISETSKNRNVLGVGVSTINKDMTMKFIDITSVGAMETHIEVLGNEIIGIIANGQTLAGLEIRGITPSTAPEDKEKNKLFGVEMSLSFGLKN